MSSLSAGESSFVDREEEMNRLRDALDEARTGKGRLLLIRGEAGCGKTRLLQEATVEAERQGFSVGFGTSLVESVVPYHPWMEVLEDLDIASIFDEHPPPKLLGLYLISPEGRIQTRVERKAVNQEMISNLTNRLAEIACDSGRIRAMDDVFIAGLRNDHRLLLRRGSTVHLGAIVEGRENEAFLADMMAMADNAESMFSEKEDPHKDENPQQAVNAQMQQLMDSEIYEGVDYSREDPKLRQNKLFENTILGLQRRATGSPLCVVIDDLQWADPSSLALLQYVTRNTRKNRVMLLGTYRVEETELRPHLRSALKGMHEEELLNEMVLKGLSREYLAELAESFIGPHSLQDDFLDRLWQETMGFPLFIREVLLGLENDEKVAMRGAVKRLVCPLDEVELPDRVRDVIRERLNRLPKEDRHLLDAAATCGTRFTASLVSRVAGEDESKVLNGLRVIAKVHGLLRLEDSRFTFDHPAVQEVLCDEMSMKTRQTYHRKAAEWLELAGGPLEEIAEHYYRSGDSCAVEKLRLAAEATFEKYANNETVRLLEEALELAAPEERGQLLEQQADALDAAARYDEALTSFDEALKAGAPLARCKRKIASVLLHQGLFDEALTACEEALDKSDRVERGRLLAVQAEVLVNKGKYSAATQQAKLALDAFGENSPDREWPLHTIGMVNYYQGRCDEAQKVLLEVLALNESKGDRRLIGASLNTLGMIHWRQGSLEKALECHHKALKMRETIDDLDGESASLNNIGNIYASKGDFHRALDFFKRALAISKATGNRLWIVNQTENIASIFYHLGDLDQALESYTKCLEMREAIGGPEGLILTLYNIGNVHFFLDDTDSAMEYYQRSLSISEEMRHKTGIADSLTQMSLIYAEHGDHASAMEAGLRAVAISEDIGDSSCHVAALDSLVDALINSGQFQEARARAKEGLRIAKKESLEYYEACIRRTLARCEASNGNPDDARREFSRAATLFDKIKANLEMAYTQFEWGVAERDMGNEKSAREHLQMALELYQSGNIVRRVVKIEKMLEALDA